jgi:hypothetical protein
MTYDGVGKPEGILDQEGNLYNSSKTGLCRSMSQN